MATIHRIFFVFQRVPAGTRGSSGEGFQRGHRMIVSGGMRNSGFLLKAVRNEPLVKSVLRHGRHGIFLCRSERFTSIDIAAPKKSVRRRSSEPYSLTPEQRRTLGSLDYSQVPPGSARLHRRQQLTGFLPSAVAARTAFRTMFVDSLRLPGNYAEQTTEIFHEPTPDLRRDPQAIEQRSKLFRRRTALARSSLPSRPVKQGQVLRSRDRQKAFVTATSALLIQTWTDRTRTSPQFHRSQMTSTIVPRVSDAGLDAVA